MFVVSGILPAIAGQFAIDLDTAGQTVIAYALTYAVAAPVLISFIDCQNEEESCRRAFSRITHRGPPFVYHRAFAESLIPSMQFEFVALFGRNGGESATLCPQLSEKLRI